MEKIVKGYHRKEHGKLVLYTVEDESHEDDFGSPVQKFVPYRTCDGVKKRMLAESACLSRMEAEEYIMFGKWMTCEHCGSTYFQRESDGTPSVTSGQPA